MENLEVFNIMSLVPSTNYNLSKRFYKDMGFTLISEVDDASYFYNGESSFILQNFYGRRDLGSCILHVMVNSVDRWFQHIVESGMLEKYQMCVTEPTHVNNEMAFFSLEDPSGVVWHLSQYKRPKNEIN